MIKANFKDYMEQIQRLYPIGIQTFSEIRTKRYLYIDKTAYVYHMTHSASKYMFEKAKVELIQLTPQVDKIEINFNKK